ncbi:signal-induced proliferation-associated 1-like protein 2 isoform X2 [Toxorhynchites rutilus septentrionalis]|uniref:signal-induced proliferation-associated 1-like protein 2 isoform X2 n=1 Tax=Toxorhynchites rutilus septentrionalis TaxID=329112 RepID=UPI0024794E46|nr:signal-induced proliferation-associated 1-like protein 2 isoform X2 [Toxorhynchites rutilus septentrionalis]
MYHRSRASSVHYPIAKKTKDSNNGMIGGLQAEFGGPPSSQLMTTPMMATGSGSGGTPNGVSLHPTPPGVHHHPGPPGGHLHPPLPPQQQQQQQQQLQQQQMGGRSGGTARERAMHAVEYYNSNVLRARVGAGLAGPRNSVHERYPYVQRHLGSNIGGKLAPPSSDNLYRSNSSLELIHDHSGNHDGMHPGGTNLRREYGSHGSIDVISSDRHHVTPTTGESFLAMLQEYRPAVFGMEHPHNHPGHHGHHDGRNGSGLMCSSGEDSLDRGNASPKLRMKFNRLWSSSGGHGGGATGGGKPGRGQTQSASLDEATISPNISVLSNVSTTSTTTTVSSADIEERQRRRAFAHFDCQSLTANLGYAAKLRGLLLARRRNTTTGASAAATYGTRSSTPDGDSVDEDYGDGQGNELLESCPFFRNEIGGEEEREVSLTRMQSTLPIGQQRRAIHRPVLAYGVSVLECGVNETLWKANTCPYQKGSRPIEQIDNGALYYRQHFFGQEHQNWFGMDEQLGPVAISIKKEKLPPSATPTLAIHGTDVASTANQTQQHLYRLIVRTSELLTLRGSVIEDSIPNPRGPGKHVSTKEILEYVAPEVQINCLRLGISTPQCEQQLLKLDEQGLTNKYKVGILYCRAGQSSEEDMYNNEDAGPAFNEFLDTIGKRIRLKGFEHYKAGLDNKTDSTGTHSLYAAHQECEVMFHVSTMLPFTPNNRQQLLRKRHIGNDIVTVVFQEPGALPFTPKNIRSQFQHVFIIVRAVNPCTDHTQYRVAVSRSKEVPVFGPPVRPSALYAKGKHFADFLLSKVINAENAAHRSEKFATMATRTRQEYLKDLTGNFCSATLVDTGQKFSIFPSKKRERSKPRFSGDLTQRGAFCWQVVLHDSGQSTQVDCFLGISAETFVLIEECSRQIIFVTPCKAILGWSTSQNSLRVYYHQGECVTLNMRDTGDRDEQLEVIERLRAVTNGCGALELSLRRNPMGQLGFHVQPDGVVTQVEISGQAWTAGLRQGYRLVEICKVAVATLSHDQMVDLLKTSAQVTVTVIESFADFSPRRGCFLQNCRFNSINYENDYESVPERADKNGKKHLPSAQLQSANHRRRYERNFSPPRSSNSSGYGTGSSSRSFTAPNPNGAQPNDHHRYVPDMGTLTSSSSGHSSNDERWYDILDPPQEAPASAGPPLPEPNNYNHPKLTASSNSLPLAGGNPRPLSLHNDSRQQLSGGNPNANANIALLKRLIISDGGNSHESSPTEPLYSSSMKNLANHHHLSATEEEDLSRHNSPQLKRSATTTNIYGINGAGKRQGANGPLSSSSTSSSRNNSPRPNNGPGDAKLRSKNQAPQRNSVNYTGNSLQEDLMKLINPDYIAAASSDDNFNAGSLEKMQKGLPNSHSLGNISSLTSGGLKPIQQFSQKSRSREGINLGSPNNLKVAAAKSNGNVPSSNQSEPESLSEVIFTTARPATVISSTTSNCSSPASELNNNANGSNRQQQHQLHINEDHLKMSPSRKQQMIAAAGGILKGTMTMTNGGGAGGPPPPPAAAGGGKIPLPDMKEMDWSSLVDTATKAMTQLTESASKSSHPQANVYYDDINQVLNGVVQQQQHLLQQHQQHQQQQQHNHHQQQQQHQQQQHFHHLPTHQNGNGTPTLSDLSTTPSSVSPVSTGSGSTANSAQLATTMQNSSSLPELQTQVTQLSDRVLREQRRRRSLEHAVRRLTEENRRLQDESQAAVQQLRRFTEWFFQTIDRQS